MKSVKIELSENLKELEIISFGDEHIGDPHCDMKDIESRIEYVKNTPNAYCILGGDIMDNATKTSIGDTYTQTMSPMQQIDYVTSLFEPIKDKIIGAVLGNHELRSYKKEGIDPMRCICDRLGIADRYSENGLVIFVKFGKLTRYRNKVSYSIYVNHGRGGGRKEGAKAIRLADMASIVNVDIYIHHHTHIPMVMKEDFYNTDIQNAKVTKVTKLFVNSSASLEYGGYGEQNEFKPSSIDRPKIILNGRRKSAKAVL